MNSFALHAIKETSVFYFAIILIVLSHRIILLQVCPSRLCANKVGRTY
jgi:hypothetical protein